MLEVVICLLILIWIVGALANIGGDLIHLILVLIVAGSLWRWYLARKNRP